MTNPYEPVEVAGEPRVPNRGASGLAAGCSMLLLFCAGVLVGSVGALGLYYAAGREPILSWAVACGLVIAGAALVATAFPFARWRQRLRQR